VSDEGEQGWELEHEQSLPLEDYLPHQPLNSGGEEKKTQVYRCKRCGVRVADECDVVTVLGGERQEVEFRKVRNVSLDGTCYRCGLDLRCARASGEENKLALLLDGGEQAFVKTPYRVVVLLFCPQPEIFDMVYETDIETGELVDDEDGELAYTSFARPNSVAIINSLRGPLFETLAPGLDVDVEMELRGQNVYHHPGSRKESEKKALFDTHFGPGVIKEMTTFTEIELHKTVDLCILLCTEKHFKELVWTGYWGRKSETELAQCWRASGGNVLFGNWGCPEKALETIPDERSFAAEMRGEITRFTDGVKPGRRVREIHGEDEGPYEANNQLGLAELTERGHCLLWWPFEQPLPDRIKGKVRTALVDGLYPRWQKLSELPPAFFQPQVGYFGWGFGDDPPAPQPRPAFIFGEPTFKAK